MPQITRRLPEFAEPPVIETVLGVQFDPHPNIQIGNLTLFWNILDQKNWPKFLAATLLPQQFEEFEKEETWKIDKLRLEITKGKQFSHQFRHQFRNISEDRMIQVQNGRFHYNWLGEQGGDYPSFKKVNVEFSKWWQQFQDHMRETVGEIKPNQWELTYVNHIPKGPLWNEPADWVNLFPSLVMPKPKLSRVSLESMLGEWHYEINPKLGRLHVNIKHARSPNDELIILTLTARGPIHLDGEKVVTLEDGLNIGHEAIVLSFLELTSETAHEHWKIKNEYNIG